MMIHSPSSIIDEIVGIIVRVSRYRYRRWLAISDSISLIITHTAHHWRMKNIIDSKWRGRATTAAEFSSRWNIAAWWLLCAAIACRLFFSIIRRHRGFAVAYACFHWQRDTTQSFLGRCFHSAAALSSTKYLFRNLFCLAQDKAGAACEMGKLGLASMLLRPRPSAIVEVTISHFTSLVPISRALMGQFISMSGEEILRRWKSASFRQVPGLQISSRAVSTSPDARWWSLPDGTDVQERH